VSATIIPFPTARRSRSHRFAIVVHHDERDGWYVVRGSHGWIHSDVASAWADAAWLSNNLGFPIRVEGDL
jgi:hypothetical protein